MGSYVVRIDDIAEVIRQMDVYAGKRGGVLSYNIELIKQLASKEFERIRWFYYCDDRDGNTIRLYDTQFFNKFNHYYDDSNYRVILRGKNLGSDNEDTKKQIINLFSESLSPPRHVNTNKLEECNKYFEGVDKNNGDERKEETPGEAIRVEEETVSVDARFQKLINETFLDERFFSGMESLLKEHRQIILEGPPGAGKTWIAEHFGRWFAYEDSNYMLWPDKNSELPLEMKKRFQIIQFHESYGYEDFFQGIRPVLLDANGDPVRSGDAGRPVEKMVYETVNGAFYNFCSEAREPKNADKPFVLTIDEINRGKASRIFGELLYLLEYRDAEIQLASGETFSIPKNVYIIGTMNTADRSIALVDYALRRRFKFISLRPYEDGDAPVLRRWLGTRAVSDIEKVVKLFCELNKRVSEISEHQIVGHSYFMIDLPDRRSAVSPSPFPENKLKDIWRYSIMPLMAEYQPHLSTKDLEKRFGFESIRTAIGA